MRTADQILEELENPKSKSVIEKIKSARNIEDVLDDPDLMNFSNPTLKKSLEKFSKIVDSRFVRRAGSLSSSILDIAEKVKSGNPSTTAMAVMASVPHIKDFLDIEDFSELDKFIIKNNLIYFEDRKFTELVSSPNILEKALSKKDIEIEEDILVRIELGEKNYAYLFVFSNESALSKKVRTYSDDFYVAEDFSFEKAYEFFWQSFGDSITLNTSKVYGKSVIQFDELPIDTESILYDEEEGGRIGHEITVCQKKNKSRSYLLVGPPGTGKTSLCSLVCQKFCPRILKVSPNVVDMLTQGQLEQVIESLMPNALIIDDIDRVDLKSSLLGLLEVIKIRFPKIVIFASANSANALGSAIIRPGRFDRVIWIDYPDKKYKARLIDFYCKKINLELGDNIKDYIINNTENYSQAYIIEMLNRASIDYDIESSIKGSIKEFNLTLEVKLLEEK